MRLFEKIFGKKSAPADTQPLRIQGVNDAPVTPEPDDAEVAAQALLEMMSKTSGFFNRKREVSAEDKSASAEDKSRADYYHRLAERIRLAHLVSERRTLRYVAFCEQELSKQHLPLYGKDSVEQMEVELYKRIDVVDHVGGELKRRWQHCLAEVTVRLMEATDNEPDSKQD